MTATVFAAISLLAPHVPHNDRLQDAVQIVAYATHYHLDPLLVVAVAFNESSFNRDAVNERTGAAGLMGIAPINFTTWRRRADATDIQVPGSMVMVPGDWIWNIATGTRLLAKAIKDCRGRVDGGLSLYSGHGNCRTSKYSDAVLATVARIRGIGVVAER